MSVQTTVHGVQVCFQIDTGSSVSLISQDVFNRLPESIRSSIQMSFVVLYSASGHLFNTVGKITVEIPIQSVSHHIQVHVSCDGILGVNALQ
jgi:hypothetical protein